MTGTALAAEHDVLLLDLDGVVYHGSQAVPHAVSSLTEAVRRFGTRLAYVTNNASRTPEDVAQQLVGLGLPAEPTDVVTSAQAGARVLSDNCPEGSKILVVGGPGLHQAVAERGFDVVTRADEAPVAVIQGFSKDVGWRDLAEAVYALKQGAAFVATNTDRTIPTDRGIAPGNGMLVQVVREVSGVVPTVAGKPELPLMRESIERTSATRPLVVGDRLDTDIEGANAVDVPSLLVLTGVSTRSDAEAAPTSMRPTYMAADLRGLLDSSLVVSLHNEG